MCCNDAYLSCGSMPMVRPFGSSPVLSWSLFLAENTIPLKAHAQNKQNKLELCSIVSVKCTALILPCNSPNWDRTTHWIHQSSQWWLRRRDCVRICEGFSVYPKILIFRCILEIMHAHVVIHFFKVYYKRFSVLHAWIH